MMPAHHAQFEWGNSTMTPARTIVASYGRYFEDFEVGDTYEHRPGRTITAKLKFRMPVLAVSYAITKSDSPIWREVDGTGVLLPRMRENTGLPRLISTAPAPNGNAGEPWGNDQVEKAAALAGLLLPHQRQFKISQFDIANGEFRLTTDAGASVLWGKSTDADAAKLRRLLGHCDKHGTLDRPDAGLVHDLR